MIKLKVIEYGNRRAAVQTWSVYQKRPCHTHRLLLQRGRFRRLSAPKRQNCGTPPIRKPGFSPALSNSQANKLAVVVLP